MFTDKMSIVCIKLSFFLVSTCLFLLCDADPKLTKRASSVFNGKSKVPNVMYRVVFKEDNDAKDVLQVDMQERFSDSQFIRSLNTAEQMAIFRRSPGSSFHVTHFLLCRTSLLTNVWFNPSYQRSLATQFLLPLIQWFRLPLNICNAQCQAFIRKCLPLNLSFFNMFSHIKLSK